MRRALALDEGFGGGAIHDFFIAYEGGRPAAAGGSGERARAHFDRALELARGQRVAPLVGFAETVCVAEQDRAEFDRSAERGAGSRRRPLPRAAPGQPGGAEARALAALARRRALRRMRSRWVRT